jgi:hypothetical protein
VRLQKPIDTPYGPYTDQFGPEQHKFGPFEPIRAKVRELAAVSEVFGAFPYPVVFPGYLTRPIEARRPSG